VWDLGFGGIGDSPLGGGCQGGWNLVGDKVDHLAVLW
jgi:hypothetical protein